jgi:chorismate mutase/prephenate dehydrogenase
VLLRARSQAEALGVSTDLAERLLTLLIESSLTTQEHLRVSADKQGNGKSALVIGGAGKMGRWFADFLASQGFDVEIADPTPNETGYPCLTRWQDSSLTHNIIVVATPLGITATVLKELATLKPKGLVFDLASVKTPLRESLLALGQAGVKVTSLHPMFGPDTHLLSNRHVIFVDLGNAEALNQAQELFRATMAECVTMGLEEHDRLMAYVLGLSHAVNIAFFTALADSGEAAPKLSQLSSTTFNAQLAVAGRVAQESPALYFEIQALNAYSGESLAALLMAVERLRACVRSDDAAGFQNMMLKGLDYLHQRDEERGAKISQLGKTA